MIRLVMTLLGLQVCLGFSALRFGSDSAANDISLFYDGEAMRYAISFDKNF
jgi:hypothetical protein